MHVGDKECNTDVDLDCRVTKSVYRSECNTCRTENTNLLALDIGTTGTEATLNMNTSI